MIPGAANTLSSALARFPLGGGEVLDEEPLYVNAKQYHRILKRRQARAKLEAEGKIPKQRQVCVVRSRLDRSVEVHANVFWEDDIDNRRVNACRRVERVCPTQATIVPAALYSCTAAVWVYRCIP